VAGVFLVFQEKFLEKMEYQLDSATKVKPFFLWGIKYTNNYKQTTE